MQAFTAGKNEDGMRLDKLIDRVLPEAGKGFAYKMLRKKNIVLNDKRAEGNERIKEGDVIKFYLSDETFGKLAGPQKNIAKASTPGTATVEASFDFAGSIVYEDADVILVNKPVGVLTQKAQPSDVSLNEYLISYLLASGKLKEEELSTFRPSVCNRLDRNTSGLVCCGISIKGLRALSEMFRNRTVHKYYLAICKGRIENCSHTRAFLTKDEKNNKVTVSNERTEGSEMIETAWSPLRYGEGCTLLEIELFTGKSHQIRAHLASKGNPVAGDNKYGDIMFNRSLRDSHRVKSQLLTAYRIVFPQNCTLEAIAGKEFKIATPGEFFLKP